MIGYEILFTGSCAEHSKITLQRGCRHTRKFAEHSPDAVVNGGITMIIPDCVSKPALERAYSIISEKLYGK